MARISSYNQDYSLNKLDKVLGTDSGTGATKNYTIESLAEVVNEAGLIQVFDGAHYEFKSYVLPSESPAGVINFNQSSASTVNYANINTVYISVEDANNTFLGEYLSHVDQDYIKINKKDDLNNFGIYKVTALQQPNPQYRTLSVTCLASGGQIEPGDKVFVSNFAATVELILNEHSVTELNDVTHAGSGQIITTTERNTLNSLDENALLHSDVADSLDNEGTDVPLSANQGKVLKGYVDTINTLLTSDNVSLDTLQEVVDFIEANRDSLDNLAINNIAGLQEALNSKQNAEEGKGLSANDFTDLLLQKLQNIAAEAEVNVQSDWTEAETTSDAFIQNKPTDVTDLSLHNVTELADINDPGSGSIITGVERDLIAAIADTGSGSIITGDERTKLSSIVVNTTDRIVTVGQNSLTVPPANAEQNVNADWDATSGDAQILNKPALAPANAEQNVQADWNEAETTNDAFILNKPTDLTDLSQHSAADLNDISAAGSGEIITAGERGKLNNIEAGAEVNVQADWNEADANSDAFINNKPSLAPSNAEQNVQANWTEASASSDAFIQNKPTDITDLSSHSVEELQDVSDKGSGAIMTDAERTKLNSVALNSTSRVITVGETNLTIPPSNAEVNVQADWTQTDVNSDSYILNKPALAPSNAEQNVQPDWSESDANSDAFILNKPTDLTVLSNHNVTELADVSSAGSGNIITDTERTKLSNIEANAEVNVKADWAESATTSDAFILNKPTDITDLSTHSATELNDISDAGSGAVITTGERNKLSGIAAGAEVNVQANWNATSGDALILNKPTLAPSNAEQNVQADWNETNASSDAYIQNKPSVIPPSRTITVQGTTNKITVNPNTAQDLSQDRTVTISLPDDVTVSGDITVGETIELSNAQSTTPSFDNGIYYSTEDGHDTLHFRYHGHDLSIDRLTEVLPTGILNGGELSKANNTQFTIAAGDGIINNLNKSAGSDPHPEIVKVLWNEQTITVFNLDSNDTDQLNSWIYVDSNGTVQQQAGAFTDSQKRNNIIIGSAIHSEGVLKFVKTFPITAYNSASQLTEFANIFGPLKKSGHLLTPNGANLSINRSAGVAFALGRNYATDPENPSTVSDAAQTAATIHRYYRDGSGGYVLDDGVNGAGYTTLDPTKYDDGDGTLAAMSGGHYSVQRLFYFPGTPSIIVSYYGHDEYNSMDDAEKNYNFEDFTEAENTAQQAIYLGAIIMSGGATALNNSSQSKILTGGTFRGLASVNVGGVAIDSSLGDLVDVEVASVTNGQALIYDSSSSRWEPGDVAQDLTPIYLDTTNNRVGINKDNIDARLHISGTSSGLVNQKFESPGLSAWRLGIPAGQTYFAFDDSNDDLSTPEMVITTAGNVGIGTSSPTNKLEVYGGAGVSTTGTLVVRQSGDGPGDGISLTSSNATSHRIWKNASGALNISPSSLTAGLVQLLNGNIGIGTSSPSKKLHVDSGTISDIARFENDNGVFTLGQTSSLTSLDLASSNAYRIRQGSDVPFYIKGDGNVGIGTTSPHYSTHIKGAGNFKALKLQGGDQPNEYSELGFLPSTADGTNANIYIRGHRGSDGAFANNYLTFGTGSTEQMRIDSSGRVGIGTSSPSSYYAGANNLVVGGNTSEAGITIASTSTTDGNIYFSDGTGGQSAYAGYIEYKHSTDDFRIGVSGSERMRIDSSGNVGIGTISPEAKLHVNGDIKCTSITRTDGLDVVTTVDTTLQLAYKTWTDTGISGTDLSTGTYAVQVYVETHAVGGASYDEYYSGIMSWFGTNTNSDFVDEIVLHRAGHYPGGEIIQLRTQRALNADSHDLMLQILSNDAHSAPMDGTDGNTIRFKFRKLI